MAGYRLLAKAKPGGEEEGALPTPKRSRETLRLHFYAATSYGYEAWLSYGATDLLKPRNSGCEAIGS